MKQFIRPVGHEKCRTSSTIMDTLSFGSGCLDTHGFWEKGCTECARAWEQQFPEDGPCWPFSKETLLTWKVENLNRNNQKLIEESTKFLTQMQHFQAGIEDRFYEEMVDSLNQFEGVLNRIKKS